MSAEVAAAPEPRESTVTLAESVRWEPSTDRARYEALISLLFGPPAAEENER